MDAALHELREQVRAAAAAREPLRLRGGDTRRWLGRAPAGRELDLRAVAGIVSYEPSELVITARCGTRIDELEAVLEERGQVLAFEPPRFAPQATLGGCIATGLAGPRRMARQPLGGALRDHVLGVTLMDGRGELLRFGGTVIKNVAGYDVSRLLVGSFGVLGILTEISLKVLPRPVAETTLRFECDADQALHWLRAWQARPLPCSASLWCDGELLLRLSGAGAAVAAACRELGGERVDDPPWQAVRDHRHPFFAGAAPLWRIAVPATVPSRGADESELIEWGGTQRWLRSTQPAARLQAWASGHGGHASCWRGDGPFMAPLAPAALAIQLRLKQQFDPAGILNPQRLFAEF